MAQSREQEIQAKARYYANCLAGETQGSRVEATLHAAFIDVLSGRDSEREADQELIRKLTEALANMECGECGHKMHRHLDQHGCEYDRGDGYIGGSEVLQALGPCGCKCTNSYLECERQAIEALRDAKKG